nr:immunoglobulin heavy chain junction region [Mus musculus]MBK4183864.1 immunoglobulin heavy chain junction region [Mus musculus]
CAREWLFITAYW